MHEIHRPHLVNRCRFCQRFRLLTDQARLWLNAQVQLPVNLVDTLVVSDESFHIAQIQKAQPKAPLRWLLAGRISQSAISAFSDGSFAGYR
jgi:hypothetical protein